MYLVDLWLVLMRVSLKKSMKFVAFFFWEVFHAEVYLKGSKTGNG